MTIKMTWKKHRPIVTAVATTRVSMTGQQVSFKLVARVVFPVTAAFTSIIGELLESLTDLSGNSSEVIPAPLNLTYPEMDGELNKFFQTYRVTITTSPVEYG